MLIKKNVVSCEQIWLLLGTIILNGCQVDLGIFSQVVLGIYSQDSPEVVLGFFPRIGSLQFHCISSVFLWFSLLLRLPVCAARPPY